MKPLFAGLLTLSFAFLCSHKLSAVPIANAIKTIRAVGKEGQGNTEAAKAWQSLAKADAAALPKILEAMDGANPLAANWLRAAVDTIVSRAKDLPQMELMKFIANQKHDPRARRLAYELIKNANPQLAAKLIPGLLNDPSVELRRDAVHILDLADGLHLHWAGRPIHGIDLNKQRLYNVMPGGEISCDFVNHVTVSGLVP